MLHLWVNKVVLLFNKPLFLDHAAQLADSHAARRFNSWRQTEDHDHLHHWRPCSRRGCQPYFSKGTFNGSINSHGWEWHTNHEPLWALCPCSWLLGDDRTGICVAVSVTAPLGWRKPPLLRYHLWRPVPVRLWIPGEHKQTGHHSTHWQVNIEATSKHKNTQVVHEYISNLDFYWASTKIFTNWNSLKECVSSATFMWEF